MKKIGIVGFGVVGKSVLRFFEKSANHIAVWDRRELPKYELKDFHEKQVSFFGESDLSLDEFCKKQDQLIISPGVDFRAFEQYLPKCISELDLFAQVFSKKTIAITGTVGKTTTTKLLESLIPGNVQIGGNVGRGMLELTHEAHSIDTAVLELSSFQLEYSQHFAPDIAIWTNFYPNHLDRHKSVEEYFDAKCNIFAHQNEHQYVVLSKELLHGPMRDRLQKRLQACRAKQVWVDSKKVSRELLSHIPNISFVQNWLFVLQILELFGISRKKAMEMIAGSAFSCDAHRLEFVATINDVDFYNDSKATVTQATMAAVDRLSEDKRSIVLILGGIDKGVDRSDLLSFVLKHERVKKVLCFGAAAKSFPGCESYDSLEAVVRASMQYATATDKILFSPSGASFDLFANYKERGDAFKRLVLEMK